MVHTDQEHVDVVAQGGRCKRFFTTMTCRSLTDDARERSADTVSAVQTVGEDFAVAKVVMVRARCQQI
jgi:hypothetical protein